MMRAAQARLKHQRHTAGISPAQFEAGQNSKFHIIEELGGSIPIPGLEWICPRSRRLTLRGATVEDSCEWAIAIREAMAASSRADQTP